MGFRVTARGCSEMVQVKPARFPEDLEEVLHIFREYITSPSVSLDFQNHEAEFASLPGQYAAPEGGILLAWKKASVVGCVAFRRIDERICEMKRFYVRPASRGEGVGLSLIQQILEEARYAGYSRICLDVLPEFNMALLVYESLGFQPAPPVAFSPVVGTRYLGLDL